MKEIKSILSNNSKNMKASDIRELLKLLDNPEMISFAGGLPNPDVFPIDNIKNVIDHTLSHHAKESLQYGATEGHNKLREAIAKGMEEKHSVKNQKKENILITSGSQQALSLLSQIFINPNDIVISGNPTYLGAILAIKSFSGQFEVVEIKDNGIDTDLLELKIKDLLKKKIVPKFLYLIPNSQNPTGITTSIENRKKIYELICKYDLYLVEDDPYGLITFSEKKIPIIKSLDTEDRVIYLSSFSKILAPGFRVAWINANEEIIKKLAIAKQAQDLCTNNFGQYCIFEAMHHNILFPHIDTIIEVYKKKRDIMINAINKYFPKNIKFNIPEGGLFIWIELPQEINSFKMLTNAIKSNVAYVPGQSFYPNSPVNNTLRINYSYSSDEIIIEGIKRLGKVIKEELSISENDNDTINIF